MYIIYIAHQCAAKNRQRSSESFGKPIFPSPLCSSRENKPRNEERLHLVFSLGDDFL